MVGRLAIDPDIRRSQNSDSVIARYRLAVDRRFKSNNPDEPSADFISCIAFGKGAEFAEKYLRKGTKILVEGHIQTGSYTNREGQKVYTTDVVVETHEFVEPKNAVTDPTPQPERAMAKPQGQGFITHNSSYEQTSMDDFMPIPDDVADDGLPFA